MKKIKAVLVKVPPNSQQKVGDRIEVEPAEFATLYADGYAVTASEYDAQESAKAKETEVKAGNRKRVTDAVARAKGRNAIAAADTETEAKWTGRFDRGEVSADVAVEQIDALPGEDRSKLTARQTNGQESDRTTVEACEAGFRDTLKGYLKADEPFRKTMRTGGILRVCGRGEGAATEIAKAVEASQHRARLADRLQKMIAGGADVSRDSIREVIKAGDYADPAGSNPLGILNTGLLLQWNLGFLAYQLPMIDDITTDISSQPALFEQVVRTRYMKIPKLMLKSTSNAWPNTGAPTGTDVDVNVLMDTHAGVPISINNNILAATPRQLFNEQRQPIFYSLAQYITYKLIYTAINGNTRIANDGTSTSTITFNPGYTSSRGDHVFGVKGANLATFTADFPEAMDEAQFPGGDEAPGSAELQRFAWAHGRVYSTLAADTNFMLNQSIWGAVAKQGGNLLETGKYDRVANVKWRKSQLATDQCSASGTGADSTTNGITVSAGTFSNATTVGICGTKSALLFVSRVPLDYTKVLPDVPQTAAIELASEPKTGLTFVVVKFLDHAYETANMRAQVMFGVAIGDERQGMLMNNI